MGNEKLFIASTIMPLVTMTHPSALLSLRSHACCHFAPQGPHETRTQVGSCDSHNRIPIANPHKS